jgi:cytoskeletal protein RodZ
VSIGESLAEARTQVGLTVTKVSERTRIREPIIRAIEQGDFSPCGGDFYARGHIRGIAHAVGLDPEPLIREYDAEHGAPGGGITAAEAFEPSSPIRIRERRSPSLSMIVIVLLLGIIGYSAYHLVSSGGSGKHAAAALVTPHASPQATAVRVSVPHLSLPVYPANEVVLHLTATANCWVQLSTATGTRLYMGVVAPGATMTWTEKQPVTLILGNPGGVILTANGKPQHLNPRQTATLNFTPAA